MPGRRPSQLVALLLALAPVTTQAEVRVETDGSGAARVAVQPVDSRIWRPTGRSLDVINPSGDLLGDGYPAWAANGHVAATAWVRASAGAVEIRLWDARTRANRGLSVADRDAHGVASVMAAGDAWAVAWRSLDATEPLVRVAIVDADIREATALPGRLVGALRVGRAVALLAIDPERLELRCVVVRASPVAGWTCIPAMPIPGEREGRTLPFPRPVPIPGAADPLACIGIPRPVPIPIDTTTADGVLAAFAQACVRYGDSAALPVSWPLPRPIPIPTDLTPSSGSLADSVALARVGENRDTATLAWPAGPGLTAELTFDELGPVGEPVLVRGARQDRCEPLQ